MHATADYRNSPRITAVICFPYMFTSEACLFCSEDYFQGFITEGCSEKWFIGTSQRTKSCPGMGANFEPYIKHIPFLPVEVKGQHSSSRRRVLDTASSLAHRADVGVFR
ncbi:DUF3916 domain-containing protein [Yersinia canariae]|uniref:DUF3916 domain-containing protein n=1 Tax=Yersinia canariae TaxID=2607663 RepID=UPI002169B467|nr:DUF3916 domain-containing protein [Yersinia canariae]